MGISYDLESAERAAASARSLAPGEAEVHYVSGQVSFARRKWKQARTHQEQVLAIDPVHSNALNELGRISLKQRHATRAADYFVRAARSDPGVTLYSQNLRLAVGGVIGAVIVRTLLPAIALVFLGVTLTSADARPLVIAGLSVIAALSAGLARVSLRGLPPDTRPLYRSKHVARAFSVVYGALAITVIVAAAAPARTLQEALLWAGLLVVYSAIGAAACLRPIVRPATRRGRVAGPTRQRQRIDSQPL